jgi:hypothetical protein
MKKAAMVSDRELSRRTPVDTGRARTNWIATLREPSNHSTPSTDVAAQMSASAQVISQFKLDDGTIFLTNNLTYIQALEEGHSRQAPNGFAKQSILVAGAAVRASKLVV